ncbi:metallophosphoesterase [Chloroflexales bacterium ZM16-3]|nr:metallophosphoesterase [Chloroflexales bacterium ZM16-3]
MATTSHKAGNKNLKRPENPFAPLPGRVRYSARWLGMSAGAAGLAALAVARGGRRAAAVIGAAGLAGAAYATMYEPSHPKLERVSLRFHGLPLALDGMRIGQLSDLHLGHGYSVENTRWAVAQMLAEAPDLLALTGDLVSYTQNIADLPGLLAPLRAPLGIYAVPGNHDHWEGMPEIAEALRPLGVEFLVNDSRRLHWRGTDFTIAGVDDAWDGEMDMAAALAGAPTGDFTVLLCHMPDMADEAAQRGVDLQLSGHTHGGHLRLPLLGSFVLPRYGWRYPIGLHHIGRTQVYVSRGVGGMPLRLGCPPEATIITLRRA